MISRFVGRAYRLDTPGARDAYLRPVESLHPRCDWSPLCFALMSSHVHWGLLSGDHPCASFTRPVHTHFATWLNRSEQRLGPVFAGRPRTVLVPPGKLATLVAYIHNNPVRAGVVADPAASPWTSHRAWIGLDPAPPWLDVDRGLALCGFDPTPRGRAAFHAFVVAHASERRDPRLVGDMALPLRVAVRRAAGAPLEVAGPSLRDDPELTSGHLVLASADTPLRPRWPGDLRQALACVAEATGVTQARQRSRDRTREVVRARTLFLVVAVEHLHWTLTEAAATVGVSVQAASRRVRGAAIDASLQGRARILGRALWGSALRRVCVDGVPVLPPLPPGG